MRQFSRATRIYIWTVIASGAVSLGYAASLGLDTARWPLLAIGCALALAASSRKVKVQLFGRRGASENSSTMSLGFVPTFFLLLTLGPLAGMLAAGLNALASSCLPWHRRSYYYQVLFSIASVLISVLAAAMILRPVGLATGAPGDVFSLTNPARLGLLVGQIPALIFATLVYYLLNTLTVAGVLALISGKSPAQTWLGHFLWTGPGYFAGMSCAVIAHAAMVFTREQAAAFSTSPSMVVIGALVAIIIVAIPFPISIFRLYKLQREKEQANERHIEELERKNDEMKQVFMSTVESLALAIESKDRYTNEHILRVQSLSVSIAEEIGLSGDDLQAIETGALLHDIGKLGIPDHILGKPGKLTDEEYAIIKSHPDLGAKILNPVPFPWPVMGAVRSHHERWDGKGYPDGLAGEDIPLQGRILAVADVYDALTSDRSYREGWPHERAVEYIRTNAGSHFDPEMVQAFLAVLERSPEMARAKTAATAPVAAAVPTQEQTLTDTRDAVTAGINRASFEYYSLYEISQSVSATLNLHETLSLLAGKISSIFNASACALFLLDDGSGELTARRAVGVNEAYFHGARTRIGEESSGSSVTGAVARSGEGFVGEYSENDLALSTAAATAAAPWVGFASCLIAPLFADGRIVGTVNLYQERAEAFDTEDLRVLLAVSAQAGRAIHNAREYERTRESAVRDALTGLYNARYLSQFLKQEIDRAAHEKRSFSVLMLDLDNFKPVNDTFGHARGDEVLRGLGGVFESALRGGDLVTRYAGDEFVIVLPGASESDAAVVAEKLRDAVSAYGAGLTAGGGEIRLGVSIGSATFPQEGADEPTLIASADRAMYRDKNLRKARAASEQPAEASRTKKLRLVA